MKRCLFALSMVLTGCTTVRETYPNRTATEQMLLSEASEDAVRQMSMAIPLDRICFLDTTNFDGVDAKYAVSAIRQRLMESGLALVDNRDKANTIIEIRAGALSINSQGKTVTIPGVNLGSMAHGFIPTLGSSQLSHKLDEGIAKFSAFAYDKESGKLLVVAKPVVGRSQRGRRSTNLITPTIVIKP